MPHGIEELQKAIKRTVEHMNPGCIKSRLSPASPTPLDFKLVFILTGELREGGLVRSRPPFTSMGIPSIAPWKKPE